MHAGGVVRAIHVAAAAIVFAGALATAARPALARRYEWVFWGAALALVVTGIGNLSALGALPGGGWRVRFVWKLAFVLALVLASGARVLALGLAAPPRALRAAYAASAILAATAATLGLVLAHA